MATSFPQFPDIPPELRLKIWHHAIPLLARIIEVKSIAYNGDNSSPDFLSRVFSSPNWKIVPNSPSTLLQINSESRVEILSLPSLSFNAAETRCSPNAQINCATDTLFINLTFEATNHHFVSSIFEEVFGLANIGSLKEELQHLAGNCAFWNGALRFPQGIEFISGFKKLEEISLVDPKVWFSYWQKNFVGFEEFKSENEARQRLFMSMMDRLRETFETDSRKVRVVNGVWEDE